MKKLTFFLNETFFKQDRMASLKVSTVLQYTLFIVFTLITVFNIIAYILKRKKFQKQQRDINIKIQAEQSRVQEKLKESFF